jgi:hypothetical protein
VEIPSIFLFRNDYLKICFPFLTFAVLPSTKQLFNSQTFSIPYQIHIYPIFGLASLLILSVSFLLPSFYLPRSSIFIQNYPFSPDTRGCSWLTHCATNQKFAGSIPDGVIGIAH